MAASRLGRFVEKGECERYLHRATVRTRAAVRDIEDVADEFGLAHIGRGLDFESSIERGLATDGLALGGAPWKDVGGGGYGTVRFYLDLSSNALAPALAGGAGVVVGHFRDMEKEAEAEHSRRTADAAKSGVPYRRTVDDVHLELSKKALEEVHERPTVLYQLMLAPAKLKTGPFAEPPAETGADIHYAHSKLDYLLALPHADRSAVTLVVIDAKATDHVKLGARVQVAFYSLALKELLRHFVARRRAPPSLPPLVMASFRRRVALRRGRAGDVWPRRPRAHARREDDGQAARAPDAGARQRGYQTQRWHLGNHCFGCEYLSDCSKEAAKRGARARAPPWRPERDASSSACIPGSLVRDAQAAPPAGAVRAAPHAARRATDTGVGALPR